MRISLLDQVVCPGCGKKLDYRSESTENTFDRVFEGTLSCANCGTRYPVKKGIPDLMPRSGSAASKAREMAGWISLWEKHGLYTRPTLEDSFRIPYFDDGPWFEVASMFDMSMEDMSLKGDEVILDIGAGQGWASRYFAAKGCQVVAMDIVADEWYGLGRSWAIMDYAKVYFEPILGDGECLPFPNGHFDYVFFCGALHHFERLDVVLEEVSRVLKPGGRLIATGEPAISVFARESQIREGLEETNLGIIERRPKVGEYRRILKDIGFENVRIDTLDTYHNSRNRISNWIIRVLPNRVEGVRPLLRPLLWSGLIAAMFLPTPRAASLALTLAGGNLFIRATKPHQIS